MKSLNELSNTNWTGKAELWLDPLGNEADHSDCTISIGDGEVNYTWSHKDNSHKGSVKLRDGGAEFTDTFHSPTAMSFEDVPNSWGLLNLFGTYAAGGGPDWGWRIQLCCRTPSGQLVLQMTNITPWGEEGRAVRMVCSPA